jgi:uncharacterized protein with HEPN domain
VNRDVVRLSHIIDSAKFILELTEDGKERFLEDRTIRDAVLRNLEVIGEAVKYLSDDIKTQHSDIKWKQVAGLRDILIHGYYRVEPEIIWDLITTELPVYFKRISRIFDEIKR